ncbi:MAG: hypothetical protein RIF33_21310 [Cyclobacteriaceae bacterium]
MTEAEVQEQLKEIPVGAKLQLIKSNGDIADVVLASHETEAIEKKDYGNTQVPYLPPALLVQGKRWGVFRMEIEDVINIARVE